MSNILILDGYNLMYRARYSGMNKGDNSTVFNFFRGIRPLVEKFDPDITYFVLEGRPTKRLEVSPDYKGQRVYTNDDGFSRQRKEIINLVKNYFPFITVKHNNYECDDIINYLAVEKHKNESVTIISSDTDFIQSIGENTKLYNPVRQMYIDQKDFDYIMWKALVGDKSDNIEGFKGIGDKKAQKLLSKKEELEKFLLKENNQTKFDKNIFMIKFHDLKEDIDNIQYNIPQIKSWNELKDIFMSYEFKSLTEKDSSWNKYIKTFEKLEKGIQHVS